MIPARYRKQRPFWGYRDLAIFVLSAFPTGVAAALAAKLLRGALIEKELVAQFLWWGLLFVLLAVLLRITYGRPFWASLGWTLPKAEFLWAGIAAGPVMALLLAGAAMSAGAKQIPSPFIPMSDSPAKLALLGIFVVVLGPLCEELAFRGFLMPLLIRSFGAVAGILLTALPFALLHGPQYEWAWQQVMVIFLAGAAFGWICYRSRSTMASAVMHGTFNLVAFLALIAQSKFSGTTQW